MAGVGVWAPLALEDVPEEVQRISYIVTIDTSCCSIGAIGVWSCQYPVESIIALPIRNEGQPWDLRILKDDLPSDHPIVAKSVLIVTWSKNIFNSKGHTQLWDDLLCLDRQSCVGLSQ